MSEYKTAEAPAVSVTSNGVSWTMSQGIYGKVSNKKGQTFLTPVFTHLTLGKKTEEEKLKAAEQAFLFCGVDYVLSAMDRVARKSFMSINEDNISPETGKLDMQGWMEDAQRWTEQAEGLAEYEATIDSLKDQVLAIIEQQSKFYESGDTDNPEFQALGKKALEIGDQIKPLKIKRDAISEVYQKRAALRVANKKAIEAATLKKREEIRAEATAAGFESVSDYLKAKNAEKEAASVS
jgi:predicted lactoylglutathione lyase